MRLAGLACACGECELYAVAPGQTIEPQGNLFFLVKARDDEGWCEACWVKRYGVDSRPPLRGGLAKNLD